MKKEEIYVKLQLKESSKLYLCHTKEIQIGRGYIQENLCEWE